MFYRVESDQYINEGMPFTIGDVDYPANWLNLSTPEEKTALGLVEVITVGERKDDRYYWISESLDGATLTITSTPKDLVTVKEICTSGLRQSAYSLLLPSDWMITRKAESGKDVAQDWLDYRAAVRSETERCVALADAAISVDDVAAIVPAWPISPDAIIPVPVV